jgi:hypothetical protein
VVAVAGDGPYGEKVTVMPWVIVVILAVLALLILAGPPLERIIDRIWPPAGVRKSRDTHRRPGRR